jgi:hypothetical protein
MEEKDYRLVLVGNTQVGLIGTDGSIWYSSHACIDHQWKSEIRREGSFQIDDQEVAGGGERVASRSPVKCFFNLIKSHASFLVWPIRKRSG